MPAEKRITREVLKLTNITFLHFHLFKLVFSNAKKLTTRKLFGKYFHQLTTHAPIQYRIISGNSVMCENQERIFHLCKDITKKTSTNHPFHVIGNLILRYQIEKKINSNENKTSTCESDISKKYKCLQSICLESRNTVFPKKFIKENYAEWQLVCLSDYVYQGQNVWWKVNEIGIEFMDGSLNQDIKDGPLLRHFRSSSITDSRNELTNYWEMCI